MSRLIVIAFSGLLLYSPCYFGQQKPRSIFGENIGGKWEWFQSSDIETRTVRDSITISGQRIFLNGEPNDSDKGDRDPKLTLTCVDGSFRSVRFEPGFGTFEDFYGPVSVGETFAQLEPPSYWRAISAGHADFHLL